MYETYETRISYEYLKTVVDRLVEPVCLIGGWAVYQHVNENFKQATGRDYIGSRDIDIGFHFETDWNEKTLRESAFARSLRIIEDNQVFKYCLFLLLLFYKTDFQRIVLSMVNARIF